MWPLFACSCTRFQQSVAIFKSTSTLCNLMQVTYAVHFLPIQCLPMRRCALAGLLAMLAALQLSGALAEAAVRSNRR